MSTARKNTPSPEGQQQLEILRKAVCKALERKRRLGQYAVIWKEGKLVIIGGDAQDQESSP